MKIKVESPTSEINVELNETDKVKDLMKIVKKSWGDDYITLHHNSIQMQSDQPLSEYHVKDGSVIKVEYFAESP